MTPADIRSLYVETLARESYARWKAAYDEIGRADGLGEPDAPEWDEAPADHMIKRAELAGAHIGCQRA
ncbi:hypothetical protein [Nocardia sp. NPDC057440]|uniref:hypothetical protein n=1 Tax=Nocardia sp. NPDC057440 TaxID=3346134 RepID=UPI00366BBE01